METDRGTSHSKISDTEPCQDAKHCYHRKICDAVCGCGVWICSLAMSGTYLGLQVEPSINAAFRRWQNMVAARQTDPQRSVLFGGFVFSTVGYAISCIALYRRAPNVVVAIVMPCILLVLLEGWWNYLRVTPAERVLVIMPTVVDVGMTWVLLCGAARLRNLSSKPGFCV
ncbi:hypothetical protein BU26DRAFT_349194 [Trematosphaeria pertusa]|uniref:Transmembrane protein n=1 Tax=Trematosphaeria pertusa TaxID=390896 RepID=A0A6A6IC90_9PLEO|nr:uncharacterized protein BU26DRAFT_349194 [Trematosphaeria pertusa]KAF2247522.1 hypothetical protein BU26DRAFT_349194 [Trematosphaeria pertusa]